MTGRIGALALVVVVLLTAGLLFTRSGLIRRPTRQPVLTGPLCGADAGRDCQLSLLGVEPDDGVAPLLARFADAKTSIDYVPFTLDDPRIVRALSEARDRGVRVRVMLEPEPEDDARVASRAANALGRLGIEWHQTNPAFNLTHAKYAVLDGSQSLILTFNSTAADLGSRRDFGVIDDAPDDAHFLQALFDADWNHTSTPSIPQGFVISPENSNETLTTLVGSARRSIDIYAERLDPSPLLDAIVAASRRGVLVRALTAPLSEKDLTSSRLDALARSGNFDLRVPRTPRVHAKVIVVDGVQVFLGSENVEDSPKEHRREVGIIFADDALASRLLSVFEHDWAEAPSAIH